MIAADETLLACLENSFERARKCFSEQDAQVFQVAGEDARPLIEEVAPVVYSHPAFAQSKSRFFHEKQLVLKFSPPRIVETLLRVVAARGAEGGVDWLNKVCSAAIADLTYCVEVYGLDIAKPATFSNGVRIMPFDALPNSKMAAAILAGFKYRPLVNGIFFPPLVATLEAKDVVAIEEDHRVSFNRSEVVRDKLSRTVMALTLAGEATPVISSAWVEFDDPDLAHAEAGMMWQSPQYEGSLHMVGRHTVDSKDADWVERYLALDDNERRTCDLAIERLNTARRRAKPGNKALDGAICLEAILAGDGQTEVTHKVSVRAALLLADGLAERQEIRSAVKKFYNLRSKVAHGSVPSDLIEAKAIAAEGLSICARLLRKVVQLGQPLDLIALDLGTGPPVS